MDGRTGGRTDRWMGVADTMLWLVTREILPKPKVERNHGSALTLVCDCHLVVFLELHST